MITRRESSHPGTNSTDHARALVAPHYRQCSRNRLITRTEIGMTDTCRTQFDKHFVSTRILQLQRLLEERTIRLTNRPRLNLHTSLLLP